MATKQQAGSVAVGDRYFKIGHWERIWIVRRVFIPKGESLTHVVIERESAPGDLVVLSEGVLLDPADYRPDRRDPGAENPSPERRRRTDKPQS